MKISCIVPSAGIGKRFENKDKLFLNLCGKPVIVHTLKIISKSSLISEIILVVHKTKINQAKSIIQKYNLFKVKKVIGGGKTRQESVYLGLQEASPCDYAVIHDGGRPLLNDNLLKKVILGARKEGACCPIISAKDTLKEVEDKFVKKTLNREKIYFAQTPQAFKYDLIIRAHKEAKKNNFHSTDDASLVEKLGKNVKAIMGDEDNIKITTKEDMLFAEIVLKKKKGNA